MADAILIFRDAPRLILSERRSDRLVLRGGAQRLVMRQVGAPGDDASTGLSLFFPGATQAGQILATLPVIGAMRLSAARSRVIAAIGATNEAVLPFKVAGVEIGRATFPAGGEGGKAVAAVSFAVDPTTLADVDVDFYGAGDPTLSDISFNLVSG